MDDILRLDLSEATDVFIEDALSGFLEMASRYGKQVSAFRMSEAMLERLKAAGLVRGTLFKGVRIVVRDTGFRDTVEVVLIPLG